MPLSSSSMQFSKLDRILKYTAFGSAAVLTLILILATVLEKSLGSGIVFGYIYRSPVFAVLWAVAVTACAAVISRSRQRLPMTVCVMHLSFIFILAGALATFIAGEKGALHLRYGQEPEDVFVRQDGSEARMCGNASRCIGKYLFDYGLTSKTEIALDTLSGIRMLNLHLADGKVNSVTVDMGIPADEPADYDGKGAKPMKEQPIEVDGERYVGTTVSMGNPHLVIFVNDIEAIDLTVIGPKLENHPLFPGRINVEFAQILGEGKIRMRVWERGSGITQACGTGACATAVAAFLTGRAGRESIIIMDGGSLTIRWDIATRHVLMTGEATKVFDGKIELID